jgi:hypothetical protein
LVHPLTPQQQSFNVKIELQNTHCLSEESTGETKVRTVENQKPQTPIIIMENIKYSPIPDHLTYILKLQVYLP